MPVGRTFLEIEPSELSDLSAEEATQFLAALLWASARKSGIPLDDITISMKIDVADGGIDAEIRPNPKSVHDSPLAAGNSHFQIKAGTSAAPWQKAWIKKELIGASKHPRLEALGVSVQHCLKAHGRYVLVCSGIDPNPAQRRRSIAAIQQVFASCGFAAARVEVWGQSTLVALAGAFPSLCLQFVNRNELPFLSLPDWKLEAAMSVGFHPSVPQQQVIDDIRSCLRGMEIRHVRLIGEPGLGKTRMALEALNEPDLRSSVIYVRHPEDFEHSPLFSALLRADSTSSAILVVDDCPETERASIWNSLRGRSDRIRLVSLDHGPETTGDPLMRVIQCPCLENTQIIAILADYVAEEPARLSRWAEFCSGSPRVAHAVGENLRSNPGDILRSPATVPIWDRYVRGTSRKNYPRYAQNEVVLRHIALFQRFGFEHPLQSEAQFISSLVTAVDNTITWPMFQSIVKQFRDRRILQGHTTLFLVPKALHIHLWLQFWEHYGGGVDLIEQLPSIPESLYRWFPAMFRYGHASPKCLARIDELLGPAGPFHRDSFIASSRGAALLNELAEASPGAVLRCLEHTVGRWSREKLLQLSEGRQYLVWCLEKIAIWRELFVRAANVLLRLAASETSTSTNNATGTAL